MAIAGERGSQCNSCMLKKVEGMGYKFYGWQDAAVYAVSEEYRGIKSPWDLYDALSHVWCRYTCAPRLRDNWSEENKTLGQCSITAFLVQDIFLEGIDITSLIVDRGSMTAELLKYLGEDDIADILKYPDGSLVIEK